jgi:hypothetical protein
VLVYRGKEIAAYGFGDPHPFGTDRHDVFHAELDAAGLGDAIDYGHPRPALVDELALFHTAEYIDKVSRMSAEGKGWLDEGDTPAVKGIYDAASAVVGAVLCAVDEIMHDNYRRAFIPIAGLHHAARDSAAGFCVFNDCGIAAEYLRKTFGLRRIAYVDIDAHHGDGVFYGFEDDPDLIFAGTCTRAPATLTKPAVAERAAPSSISRSRRARTTPNSSAPGAVSRSTSSASNPSSSSCSAAQTALRATRSRTCAGLRRLTPGRRQGCAALPTATATAASSGLAAVATIAAISPGHGPGSCSLLSRSDSRRTAGIPGAIRVGKPVISRPLTLPPPENCPNVRHLDHDRVLRS